MTSSKKKTVKKESKPKKPVEINNNPYKLTVTNKTDLRNLFYGGEEVVLKLKKSKKIEIQNRARYEADYDNFDGYDFYNIERNVAMYFGEIKGIIKIPNPNFDFSKENGIFVETKSDSHYEDGYSIFIRAENLEIIDVKKPIEILEVPGINIRFDGKKLIAKQNDNTCEDDAQEISPELISTIASVRNYYYEGSPSPDKGKMEFMNLEIFFSSDSIELGCWGTISFIDLDKILDWCADRLWGK